MLYAIDGLCDVFKGWPAQQPTRCGVTTSFADQQPTDRSEGRCPETCKSSAVLLNCHETIRRARCLRTLAVGWPVCTTSTCARAAKIRRLSDASEFLRVTKQIDKSSFEPAAVASIDDTTRAANVGTSWLSQRVPSNVPPSLVVVDRVMSR